MSKMSMCKMSMSKMIMCKMRSMLQQLGAACATRQVLSGYSTEDKTDQARDMGVPGKLCRGVEIGQQTPREWTSRGGGQHAGWP